MLLCHNWDIRLSDTDHKYLRYHLSFSSVWQRESMNRRQFAVSASKHWMNRSLSALIHLSVHLNDFVLFLFFKILGQLYSFLSVCALAMPNNNNLLWKALCIWLKHEGNEHSKNIAMSREEILSFKWHHRSGHYYACLFRNDERIN